MQRTRREEIDTDVLDLGDRRLHRPQRLGVSPRGVVATAHHLATDAGVEMLESGGNAFDAAVAAAFALGVCEPAASGLGGQTMLLAHHPASRRTFALDGSSRAPNRAAAAEMPRAKQLRGHRATTVPSTPAVLRLDGAPELGMARAGDHDALCSRSLVLLVSPGPYNRPASRRFHADRAGGLPGGRSPWEIHMAAAANRTARSRGRG